jgi:hypothetical protein
VAVFRAEEAVQELARLLGEEAFAARLHAAAAALLGVGAVNPEGPVVG